MIVTVAPCGFDLFLIGSYASRLKVLFIFESISLFLFFSRFVVRFDFIIPTEY